MFRIWLNFTKNIPYSQCIKSKLVSSNNILAKNLSSDFDFLSEIFKCSVGIYSYTLCCKRRIIGAILKENIEDLMEPGMSLNYLRKI